MLRQPPRSTRPDTRFPSTALFRSLGPRDGKDSIQLPLALEPAGPYADGDTVTVTGTGFVPGERVGIVQCARAAAGATREARGGVDGCRVGGVQYDDADASGATPGTSVVPRNHNTTHTSPDHTP